WPTVTALSRLGLLVLNPPTPKLALPMPTPPIASQSQSLEKELLVFSTLTAGIEQGLPIATMVAGTDVALQLTEVSGVSLDAVEGVLASAVPRAAAVAVLDALAASATASASLDEALAAVSDWPGPRLIVSTTTTGMADLSALASTSQGALVAIYDPYATA